MKISVAGRQSPLSQAQIQEVLSALKIHHPQIEFDTYLVESCGDKDQKTSLRTMGKTDFFTKEVDEALLSGKARIAIHSAKDLPEPIPEGLSIVALTEGVDPSDSLVLRKGTSLHTLPPGALIATSSERREAAIRQLRSDLSFCDIRGIISKRLEKLFNNEVDGVVIAEAALIRLGLTHLNRVTIPGETALYQGQLAILARSNDKEMVNLFAKLDRRKRELYMGLDIPAESLEVRRDHCPFIQIVRLSQPDIQQISSSTHLLFTSKTAVRLFFSHGRSIGNKTVIAIGKATAKAIEAEGVPVALVAENEHSEGVIETLEKCDLSEAKFFWPHSALSRSVITNFFKERGIPCNECLLYTTLPKKPDPLPDLTQYDSLFFTSPSVVEAFLMFYGEIPRDKTLKCQGPVTKNHLDLLIKSRQSPTMSINHTSM